MGMQSIDTIPGKWYAVTSASGCSVTLEDGTLVKECEAPQDFFNAPSGKALVSDDAAIVRETFKLAPQQKLALMGVLGGNDGLPAGYTRVEWLESPFDEPLNSDHRAYFVLGSIARNLGDSVQIATMHQLTTIPVTKTGQEGLSGSYGSLLLGQRYSGRPVSAEPGGESSTALIENFTGQYDRVGNGFDYVIWDSSKKADLHWHEQSIYIDSTTVVYRDNDFVAEHRIYGAPVTFATVGLYVFGYPYLAEYEPGNSRPGRKRWFKFWKNGELLFDLVPAISPTGAPCMFDMVSRTPYFNEGEGDFLYPGKEQEVSTFSLRRPITYAQLTEHGVCRLYRVPRGYNGTKEEYAMEHGFKPLVETEKPAEGYWVPQWRETEEEIVLVWVETEPPAEETYC